MVDNEKCCEAFYLFLKKLSQSKEKTVSLEVYFKNGKVLELIVEVPEDGDNIVYLRRKMDAS